MDTNDASNVFSGHNKYQTILFIGIIIIITNSMSIWQIFGSKFTFSEYINNNKQNYS